MGEESVVIEFEEKTDSLFFGKQQQYTCIYNVSNYTIGMLRICHEICQEVG